MPICPICGKDLKNPDSLIHINSAFHQEALKKKGPAPEEKATSESIKTLPKLDPAKKVPSEPIKLPSKLDKITPEPNLQKLALVPQENERKKQIMIKETQKTTYVSSKEKILNILNYPHHESLIGKLVAIGLVTLGFIYGFLAIFETEAELLINYSLSFITIEAIIGTIFILEFVLRLWTSYINPKYEEVKIKPIAYIFTLEGIIDLINATSFLFMVIFLFNFEITRSLIILRLAAFLKIFRYSKSFQIIVTVVKNKRQELLITFVLSMLLLFFGSFFMYIAEHNAQPERFTNYFSSMWFTAVNLFTIGYGDMVPITVYGKIVSGVISLLGITFFLLPASVLASGFVDEVEARNPPSHTCPNCKKKIEEIQISKNLKGEDRSKETLTFLDTKQKVYNLINFNYPKNLWQTISFLFFTTIITMNALSIMVETNPLLAIQFRVILNSLCLISGIIFSIEYLLRVWTCIASDEEKYQDPRQGRINYIKSPLAIIDLLVIISCFLILIPNLPFEIVQYFLILRLLVVLKIGHFIGVFKILESIFKSTPKAFLTTILMFLLFVSFASSLVYFAEFIAQPDKFTSIPSTLWFGIITFTTTGFGEIYPITTAGHFATIALAFIGVALLTLPAGILGASFFSSMQEFRYHRICPHCKFVLSKPKL